MPVRVSIAFAALFAVSAAALLWWTRPETSSSTHNVTDNVEAATPPDAPRTVAQAWQWNEFSRAERKSAEASDDRPAPAPFSAAGVHRALRDVELDANGLPVLDGKTLNILRTSFAEMKTGLSDAQVEELSRIVRSGLPGPAGEQAAKIVTDYYRYDVALRDLEAQRPPPEGLASMQRQLEETVALRRQYFGYDVAAKLFAQEEAYAQFTLASMRIQETPGLSEEDKQRLQADLRNNIDAGVLPDKPDARELEWQRRYAQFAREKQLVLDAGLSERDQKEQIEQLIATHFKENERERARRYIPATGS